MDYEETTPSDQSEGSPDIEVPEGERKLVAQWCGKIAQAKEHYKPVFERMRKNQEFARRGATKEWAESGKYTVPILARHINQAVSTLYARNPKAIYKRRPRLMFKVWDGREDTLRVAMEMAPMGDPNAMAIIQEIMAAQSQNLMLDRMGKTLTILWEYFLGEQGANFKQQLKAAVRRAKVCKVAYVKLGYQRMMEPRPGYEGQINDITTKIAEMEATLYEMQEGESEIDETSAEIEQLKRNMEDLQRDQFMLVREGPVISFPRSDQIIVDPACRHLKSLTGAGWVAEEFEMTPREVYKQWKVDLESNFKWYAADGNPYDKKPEECRARGYEVWDRDNQQCFVVIEGYPKFIKAPETPDVWMERFWPYFPIVFNEIEHNSEIYPQSDVEHGEHIQNEYNRSREALRQHRIAARPFYVTAKGLDEGEKGKLAHHADHEVIEMPTLSANQKIEDLIQRGPTANIDPNLYEVEILFNDLLRSVGAQEANLGGIGGGTATENSIAEQSRSASQSDNVDDLDEVLTELARAGGQVLLTNVTKETVMEIVGPGAVWPDAPEMREEAAKEIWLETEAGSSGRPNRAAELANMERGVPLMLQIPGINPAPLGKKFGDLLELDVEELYADGMPSITAINAMMAKQAAGAPGQETGEPGSDPKQQGSQGSQNAPQPKQEEPGPQPGYTTPAVRGAA